jgi:uncharacterized repeat protein (TIGR04052 family)
MSVPFIVFSALFSFLFLTCKRCQKKRYFPIGSGESKVTIRLFTVGLILMVMTACSPNKNQQASSAITFVPTFSKQSLHCDTRIKINQQTWSINELAFFVSELSIIDKQTSYPLTLVDNTWQSQNLALIRQSGECEASRTNLQVVFNFPGDAALLSMQSDDLKLGFTLGLPFDINHQNPVVQSSPLNDSSMFWAWRNGYKFLRWDMQNEKGDAWSFHLGSVGCESAAMVRAPANECQFPNRVAFAIPFDVSRMQDGEFSVEVDLAMILGQIEPSRSASCMFSSIDDQTCVELLDNVRRNRVFSAIAPALVVEE